MTKTASICIRFLAAAGAVAALAVVAVEQRTAAAPPGPPDGRPSPDLRPSPNIHAGSSGRLNAQANSRGGRPKVTAWQDDFNGSALDAARWINANGQAPGYISGKHIGYYDPSNVSLQGGYLVIRLTQENGTVDGAPGVVSKGGLIYTKDTYAYGTYEWRVRMSSTATSPTGSGSPVSGSVSAGFNYINNSQTEIDFEFSGHLPGWLWMVNWYNTNPATGPFESQETASSAPVPDITSAFHVYKFEWQQKRVTFYIDNVFQTSHVTNIPTKAAYFMINHWGTNNPWWGGTATTGPARYYYVDWAKYTPPQ
jgi:endo-1,3-1,4-beta-glycanase ExoK